MTTNPLQLTVEEARQQLQEAEEEVHRIRTRIGAIEAGGSAIEVQRRERELAQALLDGGDVAAVVAPSMTSGQIRVAVSALQTALAEAQSRVAQAKGALRRAQVIRLRALLAEAQAAYDVQAAQLVRAYADVGAIAERVTQATGVDPRNSTWHNLVLPRAVPKDVGLFFDGSVAVSRGLDVANGQPGAAARARLTETLKTEGIEL